MSISAKDVKLLRDKTGAGMMDCKKALKESDGDMEKAIEFEKKDKKYPKNVLIEMPTRVLFYPK